MLRISMTGYVGGFVLSRRRFLWSTALASAGLTAGAAAARAFALEEPAAGTIAEMRAGAAACAAASPYHAQVLADVRALLSGAGSAGRGAHADAGAGHLPALRLPRRVLSSGRRLSPQDGACPSSPSSSSGTS